MISVDIQDKLGRFLMTLTRVILEGEIQDSFPLEATKSGRIFVHLKWAAQPIFRDTWNKKRNLSFPVSPRAAVPHGHRTEVLALKWLKIQVRGGNSSLSHHSTPLSQYPFLSFLVSLLFSFFYFFCSFKTNNMF